MGFLDYIKSAWEWVKSAIQKVWARFKAFLVKVADYAQTVIYTLKNLAQKVLRWISNLFEKIKDGVIKFFLIFTKKNDGFKSIIEKAKEEGGKVGVIEEDARNIFGIDSDYDFHIVQTDKEYNTENVYSVSPDQLSEDMRNKVAAANVHEINFNF